MNIGTLRGGANAFRLDALLKLADVRGADGKTTLLHFVLQELARSKGLKAAEKLGETPSSCHATLAEREEYCKTGTEFVSELSNELGNVKKVASIDLDTMMKSISNLSRGLAQLRDLIEKDLPRNDKNKEFLQYMTTFLNYAENTMQELEVGKAQVLHHVGELTEYYHGEVGKDEPNLLHIFVIIKDFLGLLHRVCREMRGKKQNQPLNLVLPLR
jgi:thiol-disulfide isomerase/thioredoxin